MSKNYFKKVVTMFISFVMLIGFMPNFSVSAICCRKDGFDKSRYTLSGNMAEDVATIAKSQKGRTEAEFGYSGVDAGAWCDEFVADCLENAGADSTIVAHGGTVADFESKMRARKAVEVSSPRIGDLIFFTKSHVEIVTKVENGVVYCAGGNNGGRMCKGERTASSVGTTRLFLRPNYPNPNPPSWASVSIPKQHFKIGEEVQFTLTSDTGNSYTVGIDDENGNRVYTHNTDVNLNSTTQYYTHVFDKGGNYSCYITTYNDYGLADSERVFFTIALKGDCNADGEFNISDVVLLQKWLLTEEKSMPNWKAADLCEDDRLDVFDLCMMKRMLVENS